MVRRYRAGRCVWRGMVFGRAMAPARRRSSRVYQSLGATKGPAPKPRQTVTDINAGELSVSPSTGVLLVDALNGHPIRRVAVRAAKLEQLPRSLSLGPCGDPAGACETMPACLDCWQGPLGRNPTM